MFNLPTILFGNKEVLPIVEGGKGVSITTGITSGNWALCGGIGTVSGVNADTCENGSLVPQIYYKRDRKDRQRELVAYAISGGISQVEIAHDISNGNGLINLNVLWEMGAVEEILNGILEKTKGMLHGITCGAGMPYKLAEIAAKYNVFYYPIISSARAFKVLYRRSFSKFREFLGSVVYEDPWLAGGHVGLSNAENPDIPETPYNRVKELRAALVEVGLATIPIVVAGGVWWLSEWQDWINNNELGPIAFQFGSRPLLTKECPIPTDWKQLLLKLKKEDIVLNKFSPTGFYSSTINNKFLQELSARSSRQIPCSALQTEEFSEKLFDYYIRKSDHAIANKFMTDGFTSIKPTPDGTIIFVTPESSKSILSDQINCIGCLSGCRFSGWSQSDAVIKPDPRSFCIQKTLQDIAHNGAIDNNLLFCGKAAYRFSEDPFYFNGFIPSVKELVDRILTGF